jgi:hypothetical protein
VDICPVSAYPHRQEVLIGGMTEFGVVSIKPKTKKRPAIVRLRKVKGLTRTAREKAVVAVTDAFHEMTVEEELQMLDKMQSGYHRPERVPKH